MADRFIVYSEEQLEGLFDAQLEVLVRAGVGGSTVFRLRCQRHAVVEEAASIAFPEGHLPFAPVFGKDGRVSYNFDVVRPAGLLTGRSPTAGLVPREAVAAMSAAASAVPELPRPWLSARRAGEVLAAYAARQPAAVPGSLIDLYA